MTSASTLRWVSHLSTLRGDLFKHSMTCIERGRHAGIVLPCPVVANNPPQRQLSASEVGTCRLPPKHAHYAQALRTPLIHTCPHTLRTVQHTCPHPASRSDLLHHHPHPAERIGRSHQRLARALDTCDLAARQPGPTAALWTRPPGGRNQRSICAGGQRSGTVVTTVFSVS